MKIPCSQHNQEMGNGRIVSFHQASYYYFKLRSYYIVEENVISQIFQKDFEFLVLPEFPRLLWSP